QAEPEQTRTSPIAIPRRLQPPATRIAFRSSSRGIPNPSPATVRAAAMASFSEAPPGNPAAGEKIFKTKCAQCHTVDKGAGHKQ
uniref:Cytochrome c domain-containing protein n=1 Tax=Aegilops tauschii subsp. strangulata TaxID=200361 RepID=A0A453G717_AEGTS